jgi:hypothetical protein
LTQSRERLEKQLEIIRNLKEGETYDSPLVKMVDSYSAIYFELLLENLPDITYDITTTELGSDVECPDYYRNHGFDYFIHNQDLEYRFKNPAWRERYPKSALFYDSLDREFTLIKTFSPSATRSGHTIQIYRVTEPLLGTAQR